MVALIVVCGSSLLYFRHLLEEVAKARIVLFQVFLIVPIGIVAKLGAKSLRTAAVDADEQWDGDDDLDDAWDPQQAAAGGAPPQEITYLAAACGPSLSWLARPSGWY